MKITKTIDPIPENTARFREILPVLLRHIALKGIFSQADLLRLMCVRRPLGGRENRRMNIRSKKK